MKVNQQKSDEVDRQFELKMKHGSTRGRDHDIVLSAGMPADKAVSGVTNLCSDDEWRPPKKQLSDPRWLDKKDIIKVTPRNRKPRQKKRKKSTPDSGIGFLISETIETSSEESANVLLLGKKNIVKDLRECENANVITEDKAVPSDNQEQVSFSYDETTRELCYLFPDEQLVANTSGTDTSLKPNEPGIKGKVPTILSFDEICAGETEDKSIVKNTQPVFSRTLSEFAPKLGSPFIMQPSFEDVCIMQGIDPSLQFDNFEFHNLISNDDDLSVLCIDSTTDEIRKRDRMKNANLLVKNEFADESSGNLPNEINLQMMQIKNEEVTCSDKCGPHTQYEALFSDAYDIALPCSKGCGIKDYSESDSTTHTNHITSETVSKEIKNQDDLSSLKLDVTSFSEIETEAKNISHFNCVISNAVQKIRQQATVEKQDSSTEDSETSSYGITSGQPVEVDSSISASQRSDLQQSSSSSSETGRSLHQSKKRRLLTTRCIEDVVTKLKCQKEKQLRDSSSSISQDGEDIWRRKSASLSQSSNGSQPKLQENTLCDKSPLVVLEKIRYNKKEGRFELGGIRSNDKREARIVSDSSSKTEQTESSQESVCQESEAHDLNTMTVQVEVYDHENCYVYSETDQRDENKESRRCEPTNGCHQSDVLETSPQPVTTIQVEQHEEDDETVSGQSATSDEVKCRRENKHCSQLEKSDATIKNSASDKCDRFSYCILEMEACDQLDESDTSASDQLLCDLFNC